MSDTDTTTGSGESEGGGDGEKGKLSPFQAMLDNPFLLLFIGVALPAALYTIWGVMEITQIPVGQ